MKTYLTTRFDSNTPLDIESMKISADSWGLVEGSIYRWTNIAKIHRIRNGIYQRNGRLISLLTDFGRINPCYPDRHGSTDGTIFYTGNGRRGDQKLDAQNQALMNAVNDGSIVPLFNKLGVNRWKFTGYWRVLTGVYEFDVVRERMVWRFTLVRV